MPGSWRATPADSCVSIPSHADDIVRVDLRTWVARRGTGLRNLEALDLFGALPASVTRLWASLRDGEGPVALWVRGLPPPAEAPAGSEAGRGSRRWLDRLAGRLGTLRAYAEIRDGHLSHHETVPRPALGHPPPSEFVLIRCHRGRADVASSAAQATEGTLELGAGPDVHDFVVAPDERGRETLLRLGRVAQGDLLIEGDLLLVDGRRCPTTRRPAVPAFDGTGRVLQVAYVSRTWWSLSTLPGARSSIVTQSGRSGSNTHRRLGVRAAVPRAGLRRLDPAAHPTRE